MSASAMAEGRACGDCTICCIVPGIDTPEIQKRTGAACRHCGAGGCAIYETRPRACRSFACAWLEGAFDANWRPDRCGVLARSITFQGRQGIVLTLYADPLKTVRHSWFVDYVQDQIRNRVPVMLAVSGPQGSESAKKILIDAEVAHAAAGSPEQMRQVLRRAVKTLRDGTFEPLPLLNSGNDVSS
jgi:hypothetical protein